MPASQRFLYQPLRSVSIDASAVCPSAFAMIARDASAAAYSIVADAGWAQSLSPPWETQSVPTRRPNGM